MNQERSIFRHSPHYQDYYQREKNLIFPDKADTLNLNEWGDIDRLREKAWQLRYDYEATIISHFINELNLKNIIDVGSGPGELSKFIRDKSSHKLNFDLVDKPLAKTQFEKLGYEGNFFVKDLSMGFNVEGLKEEYDLIICNDCLEHLFNPSALLQEFYKLISDKGWVFISNPNWRMGHTYIYRGLFDYDNFIYFLHVHGLELKYCFGSPLKTPHYPKLDSEQTMPEELITSWNHYLVFQKRQFRVNI